MTAPGPGESFSVAARARSFTHAFRGVGLLVAGEHNTWIHVVATVGVAAAGLVLGVTRVEWALLALAIGLVWSAEAFNTAVERVADVASPEPDPRIGQAKDVAAAGVQLAAGAAVVVGLVVFLPRMIG